MGFSLNGFVGEAQSFAFSPIADVRIYDIDPLKATHSLEETLEQEFIFVCLIIGDNKNLYFCKFNSPYPKL